MTDSYTQFKNLKKMRYEVAVSLLARCRGEQTRLAMEIVLRLIDEEEFARNGELRPMTPITSPAEMFGCGKPFIRQ